MEIKFKQAPICEQCGKNPAISFCYLGKSEGWKFCCICTDNNNKYWIDFNRFFKSPASVIDWLAHMNEKTWMDWSDFMNMIDRFRAATDSYGTF